MHSNWIETSWIVEKEYGMGVATLGNWVIAEKRMNATPYAYLDDYCDVINCDDWNCDCDDHRDGLRDFSHFPDATMIDVEKVVVSNASHDVRHDHDDAGGGGHDRGGTVICCYCEVRDEDDEDTVDRQPSSASCPSVVLAPSSYSGPASSASTSSAVSSEASWWVPSRPIPWQDPNKGPSSDEESKSDTSWVWWHSWGNWIGSKEELGLRPDSYCPCSRLN